MCRVAVILAAGEGKRLSPFTETMPKVMLPVANKPILEHVVDAVKKAGIERIVLVVGYQKEVILDYFREHHGITYVVQDKQLGTAHALLQAKKHVKKDFIILAGDNIVDQKSISRMIEEKAEMSMLIKEHPYPSQYGVVFIEKDMLSRIVEKPRDETGRFISTGIYRFPKSIFQELEKHASQGIYDLTSVVQSLLDKGCRIKTLFADLWMDVVYPWDLLEVNEMMVQNVPAGIGGTIEKNVVIRGHVSIGENTRIYSGCYITGPVIIGESCEIGPNVCIFPSTTIGNNSVIHPFSEIRNSVIMNDTHIGSNSFLVNSIIARGNIIENNFSSTSGENIIEIEGEFKKINNIGAMIGEDCRIGSHVVVDPGVIIGRKCKITSMKRIRKNIPSNTEVM
ncbi:MAG: hypothetical protein DRN05_04995 [Thermoplasmata archaeon]|nr:MAG: hypothetical protein DRN05_04995 [Thermoplasmata archaeon]